jgi:hypothetical protein
MPWTPKARSLDILVQPRRDRKAALKLMGTSKNSSLEPIRLMPFFVFLNLLKGEPEGGSASFAWLTPSIMRRMRIRPPT